MASFVFTNALVRISTSTSPATPEAAGMTNVSGQVSRVRLTREFDEHDDTHMGLTAHSRTPGLENWNVDLELNQSFTGAAGTNIDDLLHTIIDGKVKMRVAVRTCNGARSSDNPEYFGSARLFTHSPYDGAVGDLLKTNPSFRSAGNLSRFTSAS